jgi:hypothetical protein
MFSTSTYSLTGGLTLIWSAASTVFGSCPSGFSVNPSTGVFTASSGSYTVLVVVVLAEIQGLSGGTWYPQMYNQYATTLYSIGAGHNATVTGGQFVNLDCGFTLTGGTDYITLTGSNCNFLNFGNMLYVTIVQTA